MFTYSKFSLHCTRLKKEAGVRIKTMEQYIGVNPEAICCLQITVGKTR